MKTSIIFAFAVVTFAKAQLGVPVKVPDIPVQPPVAPIDTPALPAKIPSETCLLTQCGAPLGAFTLLCSDIWNMHQ